MVSLVLQNLVAGLSPEGGETETKCRCYICVYVSPPLCLSLPCSLGPSHAFVFGLPFFAYMFPHSMKHMCIKYVLPSPSCPS